jgi:hypothetical protein
MRQGAKGDFTSFGEASAMYHRNAKEIYDLMSDYTISQRGGKQGGKGRGTSGGFETSRTPDMEIRADFEKNAFNENNDLTVSKKLFDKTAASLVKPDASAARLAWLSEFIYYLKKDNPNITHQEVIEQIKNKDSKLTKEAAIHADHIIQRNEGANITDLLGTTYRSKEGPAKIFRDIIMPFSTVQMTQGINAINNTRRALNSGDRREASAELLGYFTQQAAFTAVKSYLISLASIAGVEVGKELLGILSDEEKEKTLLERIGDKYHPTDNFMQNFISNSCWGWAGEAVNNGVKHLINNIYKMGTNKDKDLFYVYKPKDDDMFLQSLSHLGTVGIAPSTAWKASKDAWTAVYGKKKAIGERYTETDDSGEERKGYEKVEVDLTPKERFLYGLNALVDIMALWGLSDAEVNRINQMLRDARDKFMSGKLGKKMNITVYKQGEEFRNGKSGGSLMPNLKSSIMKKIKPKLK